MAAEVDAPPVPPNATIRKAPKPPKVKAKMGRRPKAVVCERCKETFPGSAERRAHECSNPPPIGRPRRNAPAAEPAPATQSAPSNEEAKPDAPPLADPPHSKGYCTIFVNESGEMLETPITEETETTRRQVKPASAPAATVELAIPADLEMRAICDELGELDRRLQIHAADQARFEVLKRAVKSWFDQAPPDADGLVQGDAYLLRISARERERRVKDLSELLAEIGLDQLLKIVSVKLTELEDAIGKTRASAFIIEARTGSRRVRAIAKHPAALPV